MPNDFVWYELLTTDAEAAEGVYRHLLGWTAQDAGMADQRYTIVSAGQMAVGGLMAMPEGMCEAGGQPGWIGYVGVEDVDAHARRLEAAGGRVHRAPDDIPGVGRFAVVADPQGAVFALFQPRVGDQPPVPPPMGTPGTIGWHELHSSDWEEGFAFYAALFGWMKDEAMDMGQMGTYQLFRTGGDHAFGGMMNDRGAPHPHWTYYWFVENIDAASVRLTEKGGRILFGPGEVPGGLWIINGLDPQGAAFAIVGPRG